MSILLEENTPVERMDIIDELPDELSDEGMECADTNGE